MYFYSSLTPLRATTIAIAIVGKAITIWEAIQKRSHEPIYKTYTKNTKIQYCYRNIGTYPISPFKVSTCTPEGLAGDLESSEDLAHPSPSFLTTNI